MKKMTVVVMVLLAVFGCSGLLHAETQKNYGQTWNSMDEVEKIFYTSGFISGANYAGRMILDLPRIRTNKEASDEVLSGMITLSGLPSSSKSLVNVYCDMVTEFYKDPANALLPYGDIFVAAQYKLVGKDYDSFLQEKRRAAVK